MEKQMRLIINGKEFTVTLNDNLTVDELKTMLPLDLILQNYEGHEYYGSLPKHISQRGVKMTSTAHSQGIYYYDGWKAFTVLYGGAQIDPFKVVHIGDVNEDVATFLRESQADTVSARIEMMD